MPTVEERLSVLERDNIETKRKIAELGGQFEFITWQRTPCAKYSANAGAI